MVRDHVGGYFLNMKNNNYNGLTVENCTIVVTVGGNPMHIDVHQDKPFYGMNKLSDYEGAFRKGKFPNKTDHVLLVKETNTQLLLNRLGVPDKKSLEQQIGFTKNQLNPYETWEMLAAQVLSQIADRINNFNNVSFTYQSEDLKFTCLFKKDRFVKV